MSERGKNTMRKYEDRFRELVDSGEIAELCRRRHTVNVPGTVFGKAHWETCFYGGWKLQVGRYAGSFWRIIDPAGVRRARGRNRAQLEAFLNDRPVSISANYRDAGYGFSRYPGNGDATAVLIHGWGVRAFSMTLLAKMLRREGYSVLNYDYPSSEQGIEAHAERFLACYRREAPAGKIYFLTHSMGGLILRHAMAKMTEAECRAIDAIVMLGPPNGGSWLAFFGRSPMVKLFNASLGDMAPGAPTLDIPAPAWLPPVGIIAGKMDGKVPFASTALPAGMSFRRERVLATHPGLRRPSRTGELILQFFRHKNFDL